MSLPVNLTQVAPYPHLLDRLVDRLRYRRDRGWRVWLQDLERDAGSVGLTLVVQRHGPDSYHPENMLRVNHYFPVPPATYDERSWRRWLFDRLGDVDTHERMEDFSFAAADPGDRPVRPYAPSHGPGNNPYMVREVGTREDQLTSYLGQLAHECEHQASNFTPCPVCGA